MRNGKLPGTIRGHRRIFFPSGFRLTRLCSVRAARLGTPRDNSLSGGWPLMPGALLGVMADVSFVRVLALGLAVLNS